MLTPDQLSQLRTILLTEKEDLHQRLDANRHFDTELALIKESLDELSSYDNHPADHGSEMFEREKDIALNEHAEEQLQDTIMALEAMDQGKYGVCQICGKDIPVERLMALPTTTRCIEHTPNKTTSDDRPVEEEVLTPPFGKFEYDETDVSMYDSEDAWQEVARYGTSESPSDFQNHGRFDYDEMYIESDEPIGYVEPIEAFAMADMYGNYMGVSNNIIHEAYEAELDEADIMSAVGGLGTENLEIDEELK